MNKNKIYFSFSLFIFIIISYLLLFVKINSLLIDYSIYNTSGVEVSTLNFLFNLINNNNFLSYQKNNIIYEVYGLNFHYFYYPLVKFFQIFSIDYKLSSRLITLLIAFLIPILIIKIYYKIFKSEKKSKNENYLLYFIILAFVICHQATSWWALTYRPDFLAIYFSLLSIFFFLKYIENKNFIYAHISVFIALITWTFKQNYLFCLSSIFLYFIFSKEIKKTTLLATTCFIALFLINKFTGFNNLNLLDRSSDVTTNAFIIKNYFSIQIKFFIKNLYIIPLIILNFLLLIKIKNKKIKLFILLIFFLSFMQSSLVATLQGAGKNHMMNFIFLNLISLPIIIRNKNKIYYLFCSTLILANFLMLFQIYNFNNLGRLTLHYNNELRSEKYAVFDYIKKNLKKPIVFFGVSGRFEMLLIEDVNGLDTHQLTSFKDPLWRQWMFFEKNKIDSFAKIYDEKFQKISTVVILNDKQYQQIIETLINEKNFKEIKKINTKIFLPQTDLLFLIKEIIKLKSFKISSKTNFNDLEITIFQKKL